MNRVRFTNYEEFLEEITLDRDVVEDKIIRVCIGTHRSNSAPVDSLTVYASVIVRGKVVELSQHCGTHMNIGQEAEDVRNRANTIADKIREVSRDFGFTVRAGKFEGGEK